MKWFKKILLWIVALLAIASIFLVVSGNSHLFKGLANTYLIGRKGPSIDEYKIFNNRTIESGAPQPWAISKSYNKFHFSSEELDRLEKFETIAFLVIRKDSIVLEKYWGSYSDSSKTNSFSVAKSIVGLLTLFALDDGSIKSVDDPVYKYLEDFDSSGLNADLTIRHLLTMSSGMNFDESYGDPFGFMAKAYYGDNLREKTLSYQVTEKPGGRFNYLGGNTILLSLIIEASTGKTLSDYCSEKLWKPIGADHDALWNLDEKDGVEKAYCCFYSNARDFARIGKLYMQNGKWNGMQILDSSLLERSLKPVEMTEEHVDYYGWHWWTGEHKGDPFFYARGILGQYILVMPEKEMIIVRLGHSRSKEKVNHHIQDVYFYQDIALTLDQFLKD